MTTRFRLRQAWIIARLELKRLLLSRRGLWVYGLALLPSLLFLIHGVDVRYRLAQARRGGAARARGARVDANGHDRGSGDRRSRKSPEDRKWTRRKRTERTGGREEDLPRREVPARRMVYFDGNRRFICLFRRGHTAGHRETPDREFSGRQGNICRYFSVLLSASRDILRLSGNLSEPVPRRNDGQDAAFLAAAALARRGVLLAGKFLAGWMAAAAIFSGGALLAFAAMLWPHMGAEGAAYWQGPGPAHALRYATAAAAGCAGYGSLFLAASLWIRNPIVPAAVLLLWEAARGFLPALLQKLTVLYYLESLCPVPAPLDPEMPALLRLCWRRPRR